MSTITIQQDPPADVLNILTSRLRMFARVGSVEGLTEAQEQRAWHILEDGDRFATDHVHELPAPIVAAWNDAADETRDVL